MRWWRVRIEWKRFEMLKTSRGQSLEPEIKGEEVAYPIAFATCNNKNPMLFGSSRRIGLRCDKNYAFPGRLMVIVCICRQLFWAVAAHATICWLGFRWLFAVFLLPQRNVGGHSPGWNTNQCQRFDLSLGAFFAVLIIQQRSKRAQAPNHDKHRQDRSRAEAGYCRQVGCRSWSTETHLFWYVSLCSPLIFLLTFGYHIRESLESVTSVSLPSLYHILTFSVYYCRTKMRCPCTKSNHLIRYTWSKALLDPAAHLLPRQPRNRHNPFLQCKQVKTYTIRWRSWTVIWGMELWLVSIRSQIWVWTRTIPTWCVVVSFIAIQ